jgi:hypothetical protein
MCETSCHPTYFCFFAAARMRSVMLGTVRGAYRTGLSTGAANGRDIDGLGIAAVARGAWP